MAVRAWNALNLCDGYGGFSLTLAGFGVRTVARVERDAYAAAVLVERMEEARLDPCPVWDDLTTFDGRAWRGVVDLITAGFPCQPFSAAGQKLGLDDERWLWPAIERIIRDVEPGYVVLENVPGVVRAGLAEVLHDLAQLGFDAEWGLLAASDVGAPHRRERFWLVAHSDRDGLPEVGHRITGGQARNDADRRLQTVGYTCGPRRPEVTGGPSGDEGTDGRQSDRGDVVDGPDEAVADAACLDEREPHRQERPITRQRPRPDIGGHRFPPCRDDFAGWRQWIEQGGPQPVLRRDVDGPPGGLADALHLGGNGLVPQAAHEAIRQLLERGGWSL